MVGADGGNSDGRSGGGDTVA